MFVNQDVTKHALGHDTLGNRLGPVAGGFQGERDQTFAIDTALSTVMEIGHHAVFLEVLVGVAIAVVIKIVARLKRGQRADTIPACLATAYPRPRAGSDVLNGILTDVFRQSGIVVRDAVAVVVDPVADFF